MNYPINYIENLLKTDTTSNFDISSSFNIVNMMNISKYGNENLKWYEICKFQIINTLKFTLSRRKSPQKFYTLSVLHRCCIFVQLTSKYILYKDPLIYFDVELKRREMRCRPLHEIPETVNCNLSYNDLDVCNIKQQSFSKQFVAKVVFAQTRTISRIPQKLPVVFKKTRSVNNTTYIMNLYMPYQLQTLFYRQIIIIGYK